MSQFIDETEQRDLIQTLETLGLNSKESKVYLALLALGEVGTTALVTETKLHRQYVYDVLESLVDKGLVGYSIVRGRKKFVAHSPSRLSAMFAHKKRVADDVAARIEKKLLPLDVQQFQIYRGPEAFVSNEFEIIRAARPGSKIYVFGNTGDTYKKTLGKYFNQYEHERQKKRIEVLYLGSAEQKQFLSQNKDERNLFTYRLLPSVFTGELNISVYEDRICFYMFGSPVAKIAVMSSKIAKSYADFFMGLWQISK